MRTSSPDYRTTWGAAEIDGIASLLPSGVAAVEAVGEVEPDPLGSQEERLAFDWVETRRVEFARGRSCARRALAQFRCDPYSIARGPDGEPVWPYGLVGSIAHCRRYCCAIVAEEHRYSSLGVDAELLQPLPRRVRARVLSEAELRHVAVLDPRTAWDCVLFSAKEAIYKAWFPLTGRWLGFRDAEVRVDPENGSFWARLRSNDLGSSAAPPSHMEGRFALEGGRVVCTVVVRAKPSAGRARSSTA
jgi:4'-phosphopantetheinyl transferase EntD